MKIDITSSEAQAISLAWETINEKLEGCNDEQEQEELDLILKGLRSLELKIKKQNQ